MTSGGKPSGTKGIHGSISLTVTAMGDRVTAYPLVNLSGGALWRLDSRWSVGVEVGGDFLLQWFRKNASRNSIGVIPSAGI